MLSPLELFNLGRNLLPQDQLRSPYLYNALSKGLSNYKILTLEAIFRYSLLEQLPPHLLRFINDLGEVILIANPILDEIPQVILRGVSVRDFRVYSQSVSFPYGVGLLSPDFSYGQPILLVEGVLDRDSLLDIFPDTLALLSSSLSLAQIEMLECLTDRVLLLYDNDKSGRDGVKRDFSRLVKRQIKPYLLQHPIHIKDSGILSEYAMRGSERYSALRDHYLKILSEFDNRLLPRIGQREARC